MGGGVQVGFAFLKLLRKNKSIISNEISFQEEEEKKPENLLLKERNRAKVKKRPPHISWPGALCI